MAELTCQPPKDSTVVTLLSSKCTRILLPKSICGTRLGSHKLCVEQLWFAYSIIFMWTPAGLYVWRRGVFWVFSPSPPLSPSQVVNFMPAEKVGKILTRKLTWQKNVILNMKGATPTVQNTVFLWGKNISFKRDSPTRFSTSNFFHH